MGVIRNGTYNIQCTLPEVLCLALTSSDQPTAQLQNCSAGNSSQLQVRNKCIPVQPLEPLTLNPVFTVVFTGME